MNEDEVRAALVAAMESSARGNTYAQWTDTIMPTIREIVAEELREAAGDFGRGDNGPGGALVALSLSARADALTKPPDGPVR